MQLVDLPVVMEIEKSAYQYPWSLGNFRDCLGTGYRCRIFEMEGAIRGYSLVSIGAREAHILNLCIHSTLRGKGYGRLLLEEQLDALAEYEVDMVLLEVRPSNISAISLYESLGFNELGRRKGYYPATGGREDAPRVARPLFNVNWPP